MTADAGAALRAIRTALGLTLADVASRAGVSAASLSRAERGLSAPGVDWHRRVTRALATELADRCRP